ncbi:MAG: fumarylacetoacetate hydrolase family protein [Aggregatilineales bacterium]
MNENYFLFGYQENGQPKLGYQKDTHLYALDGNMIPSFGWLLQTVRASELIAKLDSAITDTLPADTAQTLAGLLDQQPIWAAGVTYKQSEEARERESDNSTIYTRVYAAERPEIFWKALGYETVSTGDYVGIRADATWSVPEPELTVVINGHKEVIGFTIGNDMSSRDIEGANALYLPQAKVYDDACALGPRIWLQPDATSWAQVTIQIEIERGGTVSFSGETSTAQLNRTLPELLDFLVRCKTFSFGVFLMTGTGVVPPDNFTLQAGDVIRITIDPIGKLINTVHIVGGK